MKSSTITTFEQAVQGYIDKNKDSWDKKYKLFGKSGIQRANDILAELKHIDSYNGLIAMIKANNTGSELIGILKDCAIKELASQEQINEEAENHTRAGHHIATKTHLHWIPPVTALDKEAQDKAKDVIFKKLLEGAHLLPLKNMK